MGDHITVQFPVCGQPPRSTQPGHPFVGRHNEYQPKGGDALRLGSKGRYGLCVVAGKTVWSPRYTRPISERFSSGASRAGLTIVPVVRRQGPPISCQIFTTPFRRLNVQCAGLNVTTTKKGRQPFWGRKYVHKCTPRVKSARPEKRKGPPSYVGMGPPNG